MYAGSHRNFFHNFSHANIKPSEEKNIFIIFIDRYYVYFLKF
jgi:hypothetical protein